MTLERQDLGTDVAFVLDVLDKDGVTVIHVAGELDLATGGELREAVMSALSTGGAVVVLDAVTFMDSTGLSVTIAGHRRAEALGTTFGVVCSQPQIRRLFTISGLDDHLRLHEELADALEDQGGTARS